MAFTNNGLIKENKTNMNKKLIRLTESDLHRIVKESVNRVLKEHNIGNILSRLEDEKEYYELAGVEITEEDAQNVVSLLRQGMSMDDAISDVLNGIRDVISQGWEY